MPSSQLKQIPAIVEIIMQVNPKTILDIGCGFGKYGFLAREYLETWKGNKPTIDAIEVFQDYIGKLQREIYDEVVIGEAIRVLTAFKEREIKYDLILAIDILEHFEKEDGKKFIELMKKIGKNVLISTPKEPGKQGAVFGNEYETHKSRWLPIEIGNNKCEARNEGNWIVLIEGEKL
jgi:cyclopropane fatty-acyl-phospholipid synthase-like methyltransferase